LTEEEYCFNLMLGKPFLSFHKLALEKQCSDIVGLHFYCYVTSAIF